VLSVAAALSPAGVLEAADIDQAIARIAGPAEPALDPRAIQHAVAHCAGNLSAAARLLSIPRSTLRDRLRRAEVEVREPDSENE
jgi:transcriptional regulator of acetoin/glycerol metabolism